VKDCGADANLPECKSPNKRMNEFLAEYLEYDGSRLPVLKERIFEETLEGMDILGSSLPSESVFSLCDLDSVMLVASNEQMIDIDLPLCIFYPRHVRQKWAMLDKRSNIEIRLDNGETKMVYECPSRLFLSSIWPTIGKVQVYLVSTGSLSIDDCLLKVEEAMCWVKSHCNHGRYADIHHENELFEYSAEKYGNVPKVFLTEVFRHLHSQFKNTEICFYIAGHDLKKSQCDRKSFPCIQDYVHGPLLNSRLDVGFDIHSNSSDGSCLATFVDPSNIREILESAAKKSKFEWSSSSWQFYRLLGTNDLFGLSVTSADSDFLKLKLYASTLECLTTDSHGVMLSKFKFNMDEDIRKNPVVSKYMEIYGNKGLKSFDDNRFLDCFLSHIFKSSQQPWHYRVELSVRIESLKIGIEHLRILKHKLRSELIVLKTSWVTLLICSLTETCRYLGKLISEKCNHGISYKANSLSLINEIIRNHITGCKPSSKRFSRQLRLFGFFDSIRSRNILKLPTTCHLDLNYFQDQSFFLGIKSIVSRLVREAFRVELSCLVIFFDALHSGKKFHKGELVEMIIMQYVSWTFSVLKRGQMVPKIVQFSYGPYLRTSRKFKNLPKFDLSDAQAGCLKNLGLTSKLSGFRVVNLLRKNFLFLKKGHIRKSCVILWLNIVSRNQKLRH
jgi:hypothetical protein